MDQHQDIENQMEENLTAHEQRMLDMVERLRNIRGSGSSQRIDYIVTMLSQSLDGLCCFDDANAIQVQNITRYLFQGQELPDINEAECRQIRNGIIGNNPIVPLLGSGRPEGIDLQFHW